MKARQELLEEYYSAVLQEGLHSSRGNLPFYLQNQVLKGIDFLNRAMLDIGGGNAMYSFYAACTGAKPFSSLVVTQWT